MIAAILYAVVGVVVFLVLFGLLVAVVEWASQGTWKSALTTVAHSALYVVALVAGTGALLLFIQGMGWLGAWLS